MALCGFRRQKSGDGTDCRGCVFARSPIACEVEHPLDGGIEAIWKPTVALALGPLTFPILLKFVKKDQPTEDVVVDGVVIWSHSGSE